MNRWRSYLSSAVTTFAVFALAAVALAAPGLVNGTQSGKPDTPVGPPAVVPGAPEVEDAETQNSEAGGPNHGHCVSYWAHQAKDQGLEGKDKGQFVASIAQNAEAVSMKVDEGGSPDETCDFQSDLDAALEEQEASTEELSSPGQSGETHGKSDEAPGKN